MVTDSQQKRTTIMLVEISFPLLQDISSPFILNCFGIDEFLLVFFIGLGTIAFACQLVPGVLLFVSMVRSIYSFPRPDTRPSAEGVE